MTQGNHSSHARELARSVAVKLGARLPYVDTAARTLLHSRVLKHFLDPAVGAEFGFHRPRKIEFLHKVEAVSRNVACATDVDAWLTLAARILQIRPGVHGAVVECGSYKGASTCALSLICAAAGRRLIVCDSFSGLPEDAPDACHRYVHLGARTTYSPGLFAGTLDEVRHNVSAWGDVSVCKFLPGLFSETLPNLQEPVVFAFLDVDLAASMRDCARHLWPLLVDGGYIYTDDSCDMDVVSVWFDRSFWRELECDPPGYVGSGAGLCGLSVDYSSLGYTMKVANPAGTLRDVRFW